MIDEKILGIVAFIVIIVTMYLLYINGCVSIRNMRSLKYIGWNKKTQFGANIAKCTGQIKRIIPIKESKLYSFNLSDNLTKGIVSAYILNSQNEILLHLSNTTPSKRINIEGKQKLYLKVKLENATGRYDITWN